MAVSPEPNDPARGADQTAQVAKSGKLGDRYVNGDRSRLHADFLDARELDQRHAGDGVDDTFGFDLIARAEGVQTGVRAFDAQDGPVVAVFNGKQGLVRKVEGRAIDDAAKAHLTVYLARKVIGRRIPGSGLFQAERSLGP